MLRKRAHQSETPPKRSYATASHSAEASPDRRPSRDRDAALQQVSVYEQQRAELESAFGARANSPWVSSLKALQRPDGTVYTMTAWSKDVPTLLPVADLISLSEVGDLTVRTGTYTWDDVAAHVADDCWQVRDDLAPPRVFAYAWPPDAVFDRLRERVIDETEAPNPMLRADSEQAQSIRARAQEHRRGPADS